MKKNKYVCIFQELKTIKNFRKSIFDGKATIDTVKEKQTNILNKYC